jgi:hypothetical protein
VFLDALQREFSSPECQRQGEARASAVGG